MITSKYLDALKAMDLSMVQECKKLQDLYENAKKAINESAEGDTDTGASADVCSVCHQPKDKCTCSKNGADADGSVKTAAESCTSESTDQNSTTDDQKTASEFQESEKRMLPPNEFLNPSKNDIETGASDDDGADAGLGTESTAEDSMMDPKEFVAGPQSDATSTETSKTDDVPGDATAATDTAAAEIKADADADADKGSKEEKKEDTTSKEKSASERLRDFFNPDGIQPATPDLNEASKVDPMTLKSDILKGDNSDTNADQSAEDTGKTTNEDNNTDTGAAADTGSSTDQNVTNNVQDGENKDSGTQTAEPTKEEKEAMLDQQFKNMVNESRQQVTQFVRNNPYFKRMY